jgi:hypothetical protein
MSECPPRANARADGVPPAAAPPLPPASHPPLHPRLYGPFAGKICFKTK